MTLTVKIIICLAIGIVLSVGLYNILSYIYKTPSHKAETKLKQINELDSEEEKTLLSQLFKNINKKFSPLVHMNESTRYKLQSALDYLHIKETAEEHFVESVTAGVLIALILGIFGLITTPIMALLGVAVGFLIYSTEMNGPIKQMDNIRKDIELDSSVLARFIADSLKDGNRNVTEILTSCKSGVSTSLQKELERTISELKTINQEQALVNMSNRLNSSNLTQIVIGLLGVLRGEDQTLYFDSLADKFYKEELTMIKKANSLKPAKVSKLSMILILPVVGQVLTSMFLLLMEQFSNNGLL